MTPQEFKAWFDGFTECMEGRPTDKQWKRIKRRVSEIDDTPITRTIFYDHYVRPYRPFWYGSGMYASGNTGHKREVEFTANNATQMLTKAGRAEFASTQG